MKAEQQIIHINSFIDGFKNWLRSKQGEESSNGLEKFKLNVVLDSTIDLVSPMAQRKGIQIKSIIDNFEIFSLRTNIETSIRNIITNAIKFTPQNGVIRLSTDVQQGRKIFKIYNSGSHLDSEVMGNLKSKSISYSQEGTMGEKGTGQGLSFCYDLLKEAGYELSVEHLEDGVEFSIIFN